MPHRPALRRALLPATVALTLLVAGCGSGDDESTTDPTTSTSSGASASATPSSSGSSTPSEDPSPSSTFSVPAAAGPEVETDAFTASIPKGWMIDEAAGTDTITLGYEPGIGADVTFGYYPTEPGLSLDDYERAALKTWTYDDGKPDIQPRVEIDGVEMFHHTGSTTSGRTVEVFGVPYAGLAVEVEFHFSPSTSRREQRRLIESTLASIQWK
jgi:hypothetical protein